MHDEQQEQVPVGMEETQGPPLQTEETAPANNHRTLWIVGGVAFVFVLLAGVGVYFLANKPMTPPTEPVASETKQRDIQLTEKKLDSCDFETDSEAYASAIENADMNICYCIEDEAQKSRCEISVSDALTYQKALATMDVHVCDDMVSPEGRDACKAVVNSSVEHFEETDPEYLAHTKATAHNEEAVSDYEAILETDPENLLVLVSLASAYAEQGLRAQENGENQMPYVEKALETIEKAKVLDPENAEVYRVEGYIYQIQPDYDAALLAYNTAIEKDENALYAYIGRGHLNKMRGMYDLAVEDFEKAATLDTEKQVTQIYTNLCNLELMRGDTEKGTQHCRTAIENKDGDIQFRSEAYQMLAYEALSTQDLSQANSYLTQASVLTPKDANLYVTWAKVNLFEQKYEESETHARKAIELAPTKATAQLALAQALYMQDKYEESLVEAEAGVALVDDDVSLLPPAKDAVRADLYYQISYNYRELEDAIKQKEYEKRADALLVEDNQE